ncbi:MAG TPA: hypothetical protein VE224_16590 [Pseudolabrys sp.]|nr:hypothetical protein [Pseudolabrys sp.]
MRLFARRAGAEIFRRHGKGFVVRRMFTGIEADIYVLPHADATYDVLAAPPMIERQCWPTGSILSSRPVSTRRPARLREAIRNF